MESPTSAASRVDFYGFLDRMRRPEAAGLFRSIKSFLTSISLDEPSAEADDARVQAFFAEMEAAIRGHPLWADATHQEIDHTLEGLEKYIMTKLFDRTFAGSPEDAAADAEVSGQDRPLAALCQAPSPRHTQGPQQRGCSCLLLMAAPVQTLVSATTRRPGRPDTADMCSRCQAL
ncbi:vacuolar protein sorting-associated protein 9A-like isoform X1 [Triticum dicoccoides]|uniref:vacuolar protein sorting-associated protein 9A-like isoform X1 n=1 Tax=Triticum dicoccoides TaxID=85692 RepID=UPI001891DFC9|nr:vacuolar protein sorting-associated protein 9A-like isoform X1 [Triticum dicoccoides]